ncbi:uncharacterized protein LOC133734405 [Rosa rugosa]|uniref:uncharacterized protein LOC133734405 n=1 Tax=Rosa rugosa TaxID=74645 RepID=UPI002B40F962|nr:uncharacterized protein LOC133734405 [Rosa rugosa]
MTSHTTDSPPPIKHLGRRRKRKPDPADADPHSEPDPHPPPRLTRDQSLRLPTDPHVRIGMYVALAHAGLAFSLALLYGVTKLLEGYWRPIQWAILCSMPLRELHTALVSFWSDSLNLGLFETLIALPRAAVRAATASLVDSRTAIHRLLKRPCPPRPKKNFSFSKIIQRLITFALFVILYENIGFYTIPAFAIACSVAYVLGYRSIVIDSGVTTTLSALSRRGSRLKLRNSNRVSRYITSLMLKRLKTTVAIGLIMVMIVGTLLGMVFFSYKIGMEGKFAVISMKVHLEHQLEQNYNYAERVGLKKWMDENQIPELIDDYATKFYETVLLNIDSWAADYNVTEIVDSLRHYLTSNDSSPVDISSNGGVGNIDHKQINSNINQPLSEKFHNIQSRVRNREWGVIYRDIDDIFHFRKFMSMIAKEDLAEKAKAYLLQGLDISRRLLTSSTTVLAGGANILLFMAVSLVSGAAGLFNFIFELTVFFWLLYYLITTDSGGVMDHVLGMLPLSRSTRVRCAQVLDHAVSSVLLAAAKVTFFQGCLTYLLFRFYQIHFLYMSTSLALMSAVLQITPAWLLSIPAALQLGMEAKYLDAILLTSIHQILLEYGTAAIQDEIPGQNAYLTGLSILGGIALFPSMLEGAIMGPLLMTVMIAFKNLYVEFVLSSGQ